MARLTTEHQGGVDGYSRLVQGADDQHVGESVTGDSVQGPDTLGAMLRERLSAGRIHFESARASRGHGELESGGIDDAIDRVLLAVEDHAGFGETVQAPA